MIYLIVLGRLLQYFPEFIDFVFLYAKRTSVFRKRTSGSELISIYGDYFIIITSLKESISSQLKFIAGEKDFWLLRKHKTLLCFILGPFHL